MNRLFNRRWIFFAGPSRIIASCVPSVPKRSVCACGRVIARGLYAEAACRARSAAGSMSFARVPGLPPPPPPQPPGRRGPKRSSPRGSPNEVDVIVRPPPQSYDGHIIYIIWYNTPSAPRRDNSEGFPCTCTDFENLQRPTPPYIFLGILVEKLYRYRIIHTPILYILIITTFCRGSIKKKKC